MVDKCDVRKAGLTLGVVFALWHLMWAVLVAVGGSNFVNWISSLHFVSTPFATTPFDIVTLIIGLVGAFITGVVAGAVFAYIYNRI